MSLTLKILWSMVELFLFKQDTNNHKSYENEVSFCDRKYIYISCKLNYILHKNMLNQNLH